MMLRAGAIHESARILVPVCQELLKPTCPRYFRTELEEAELLPASAFDEGEEDRLCHFPHKCAAKEFFAPTKRLIFLLVDSNKRFEGLGMSSAQSEVLGQNVQAGDAGSEKVDGATGSS